MIEHDWEKLGVLSLNTVQNNGFSVLSLKFGEIPQIVRFWTLKTIAFLDVWGGGGGEGSLAPIYIYQNSCSGSCFEYVTVE